jgi:hypothetical protein
MARRKSPLPLMSTPNGTGHREWIHFHYQANSNTPEGEVYQYLLRSPVWTTGEEQEMVNDLILARWLPYARLDRNPPMAQKAAQHALQQLVRYIDELCRDFELEHPFSLQLAEPSAPRPVPASPVVDEDDARFGER